MIVSWAVFAQRFALACPPDLPGHYTSGKDLCAVLTLAKRHAPAKILEIGTGYGETAARLGDTCPDSVVHTFDVCREMGGYDTRSPFTKREVRPQAEVGRACKGKANVYPTVLPGNLIAAAVRQQAPYQFAFVDGDHKWRRVVDDTKLALECCADNAMLVWDDYWYYCPEVGRFIDTMNERAGNMICHIGETRICFSPLSAAVRAKMLEEIQDL